MLVDFVGQFQRHPRTVFNEATTCQANIVILINFNISQRGVLSNKCSLNSIPSLSLPTFGHPVGIPVLGKGFLFYAEHTRSIHNAGFGGDLESPRRVQVVLNNSANK